MIVWGCRCVFSYGSSLTLIIGSTLSSLLALNSLTVSLQTLPPYLCVVILLSDLTLKSEAGEQLCLVAAEAPDWTDFGQPSSCYDQPQHPPASVLISCPVSFLVSFSLRPSQWGITSPPQAPTKAPLQTELPGSDISRSWLPSRMTIKSVLCVTECVSPHYGTLYSEKQGGWINSWAFSEVSNGAPIFHPVTTQFSQVSASRCCASL